MTKVIFKVIDVNEAPTDIVLSNNVVAENEPVGTLIGALKCVDPERNVCQFTVANSDNFVIRGNNMLYSNKIFNYEQQAKYVVELRASDGVNVFAKNLTINVSDVNDAPTIIGLSSTDILENEKKESVIAELVVVDEDVGQSVRCSVVNNKQFYLQKNLLVLVGDIDYESEPRIQLQVTCMDDGIPSLYASKTIDINIIDSEDPIGAVEYVQYPLYENITKGHVVATIKNMQTTFISRNPDFMMVGNDLIYIGNGVNYEETRRIYVLLEPTSGIGTLSLSFDVIDLFEPPTGLELVNDVVYVIGQEDQDEYRLMLQNHLDVFSLREKTLVYDANSVESKTYLLNFIVNEEYPFSLSITIAPKTTTTTATITTSNVYYTVRISDDENIGTTLITVPNAKELTCNFKDIIKIDANTGRIYTVGVPSAKNISPGKYVCQLSQQVNLIVYIYDGCYGSPCGNNECIDTFKSHVCKCLNGKCDGISNLESSKTNNSVADISKGALVGIVVGALILVLIILILVGVVFKKSNKTSHIGEYNEEILTNPIFISPSNRNVIVTNGAYEYLNNRPVYSLDNPIYSCSNNSAPQLPLKMSQIDMVRSLANEHTNELYGNVEEARNRVIHDLNV